MQKASVEIYTDAQNHVTRLAILTRLCKDMHEIYTKRHSSKRKCMYEKTHRNYDMHIKTVSQEIIMNQDLPGTFQFQLIATFI